jgi:hypothetical protein
VADHPPPPLPPSNANDPAHSWLPETLAAIRRDLHTQHRLTRDLTHVLRDNNDAHALLTTAITMLTTAIVRLTDRLDRDEHTRSEPQAATEGLTR